MAISYGRDWAYAHDRLRGTIVRHNDRPVVIDRVDSRGMVSFNYLGYAVSENDHIDNFNLDPVPLGFINTNTRADYIERMPARQYRQGARSNTLIMKGGRRAHFSQKDLFNCILGVYPTLETCLEAVYNGEKESYAFCKKYAIGRANSKTTLALIYKHRKVGSINVKTGRPSLAKNYNWLKEDLEANLNES